MSDVPDSLCSSLQHLVNGVLSAKIGICAREIELVQLSTGKPALEKKVNIAIDDRFKLKIPISDEDMTLEVVFNCSLPNCPPDFEINDIDFFYSVTLDSMEELIPSLKRWDHRKKNALINVISELRSAYLKYQVERLKTVDNQCDYEYNSLIETSDISADNVEVIIVDNVPHFLIKLDVQLHQYFAEEEHWVALVLRWGERSRSANLLASSNIKQMFPNLEVNRNISYTDTFSDYVGEVIKSVQNQIVITVNKRTKMRKEFIFELLKRKGDLVVSYDALDYCKCCVLLEKDGFVCLLDIRLPMTFPAVAPHYRLLSVYSTSKCGKPLSQVVQPVMYNGNENAGRMVEQALATITESRMHHFKDSSMSSFRLPFYNQESVLVEP